MKQISLIIYMCVMALMPTWAQERTVENRPYTDLRPLHFGVLVGTHVQDVELMNAGPQIIVAMTVHSRRRLSLPTKAVGTQA